MPDVRRVVEEVLRANDFLLTDPESGGLEPAAVDAVVSVATSRLDEEDLEWGAGCLLDVMDAPRRRALTEGYETYVLDAEDGLDGLESTLAADIVEDAIENAIEDAPEGGVRSRGSFAWRLSVGEGIRLQVLGFEGS